MFSVYYFHGRDIAILCQLLARPQHGHFLQLFCPNSKLQKAQCVMCPDKVHISFWNWSSSRSNLIDLLYKNRSNLISLLFKCRSKLQHCPAAFSLVLLSIRLAYSTGPVLFRTKMTHSLSVWVYDNWQAKCMVNSNPRIIWLGRRVASVLWRSWLFYCFGGISWTQSSISIGLSLQQQNCVNIQGISWDSVCEHSSSCCLIC